MSRHIAVALTVSVLVGATLTWWALDQSDRSFRAKLLFQAQTVAREVSLANVSLLSGTQTDLKSAQYQRLKAQLSCAKTINEKCRFLYMMGQRRDGTVFFFVDSEPAGSEDESPPGQIYTEISAQDKRAFTENIPLTSGPATDRWGTWISALVPMTDPVTGRLVAVLGMDFAAHDWKRMRLLKSLPPLLLTLISIIALTGGSALIVRRANRKDLPAHRLLYLQTILTIAVVGVQLSISAAWLARKREVVERQNAFLYMSSDKSAAIAKSFHKLQDIELEALARFFEASEYVSPMEYAKYTDYLMKNPAIHSWQWIQWVPANQKGPIDEQIRAETSTEIGIWQPGSDNDRVSAVGRENYYPVLRVAPLKAKMAILGYDHGSSSQQRKAMEAAAISGLATGSDPIPPLHETIGSKTIYIYRPVFNGGGKERLRGFVAAELHPQEILQTSLTNKIVRMELSMGYPWRENEALAVSWHNDETDHGFSMKYPVFAYGRTFIMAVFAGHEFMRLYPTRMPWLVGVADLILTLSLIVLTTANHRKRERLEALVAERTRQLTEAKNQAELAIRGGDLGTWDWNSTANEVVINENFAGMLGYPLNECKYGRDVWENIVHPDDLPAIKQASLLHREGGSDFYEVEHRLRHKKGHWIWALVRGRVIERDADGSPKRVCGTYLDITERKRAQEEREELQDQLTQSQKMEAVGRLAGGVAHDLNNLLSPIIGYAEMIVSDLDEKDELCQSINAILSAGLRARDLVHQLLAFSRKQALEFKPVDINQTIAAFRKLLRRTIPEDVDIVLRLAPTVRTVMADVGQIEQIIMNLAVNAADAMPDGGRLTIETKMVELDEAYATTHTDVEPGEYVMVTVDDTGFGMDQETCDRIFEPFFSTKGKLGTGLGLSTVFGIVKQHRGNIRVYSEPGKGTVFKIYLPLSGEAVSKMKTCSTEACDHTGTETILLAEDNDMVRKLAQNILEGKGYRVLPAGTGEDALTIADSHEGPVHLLLTDVVMPGMNGKELYEKAIGRFHDMKVIFMSGYTGDVIAHRGVLDAGVAYIQKPFTVSQITAKVREVLDNG